MRLSMRTRFRLGAAFATTLLLIPATVVMAQEAATLSAARQGERAYATFSSALTAAQFVSAERAPTDRALGTAVPLASDLAHSLAEARAASDRELAALRRAVAENARAEDAAAWRDARTALTTSRSTVDAILADPLAARTSDRLEDAGDAMAEVVPHLLRIATASLTAIPSGASHATTPLHSAVIVANLRDQAGALGSGLIPALVTRRVLTAEEQSWLDDTLGRVHGLVMVLDDLDGIPAVRTMRRASRLDTGYLDAGLRVFTDARAALSTAPVTLSAAQFVTAYAPTLEPITDLRDAMVGAGSRDAEAAADRAVRNLLLALGGSLALVAGAVTVMWRYERYIVGPIGNAADAILDLVGDEEDEEEEEYDEDRRHGGRGRRHDHAGTVGREARPQHQVAALQRAITALSEHALEQATRVKSLEEQANTDALTGALNHRAMRAVFPEWLRSGSEKHDVFALLDVDHFKQVNDTYGHPVGDEVLRHLVALAQSTFRTEDLVARVGGEEFAIFLKVDDPESGVAAVERFRHHVASTPIHLASGEELSYTVSIGVAVAEKGTTSDLNAAFRRADSLLYAAKRNGRNRVERG